MAGPGRTQQPGGHRDSPRRLIRQSFVPRPGGTICRRYCQLDVYLEAALVGAPFASRRSQPADENNERTFERLRKYGLTKEVRVCQEIEPGNCERCRIDQRSSSEVSGDGHGATWSLWRMCSGLYRTDLAVVFAPFRRPSSELERVRRAPIAQPAFRGRRRLAAMTEMCGTHHRRNRLSAIVVTCTALVLTAAAVSAQPPSLGTARAFAVLGATTVTNTGATVVTGELGVSPGTSITGFPPGVVLGGTTHRADMAAARCSGGCRQGVRRAESHGVSAHQRSEWPGARH